MIGRVKLGRQIQHIKEHKGEFFSLTGFKDVDDYFARFSGQWPDLYERVCEALHIEPKVK